MINLANTVLAIVLDILIKLGMKKLAMIQLERSIREYFEQYSDGVAKAGDLRENEKRARERLRKRIESSANVSFNLLSQERNLEMVPSPIAAQESQVKKLSVHLSPEKISLVGDLDQDGKPSFDVNIYNIEGVDELMGLVKTFFKK